MGRPGPAGNIWNVEVESMERRRSLVAWVLLALLGVALLGLGTRPAAAAQNAEVTLQISGMT